MAEDERGEERWELNRWDWAGALALCAYATVSPLVSIDSFEVGLGFSLAFLTFLGALWAYAAKHRPAGPRKLAPVWLVPVLLVLPLPIIASDPPDSPEGFLLEGLFVLVFVCIAMSELTVRRSRQG